MDGENGGRKKTGERKLLDGSSRFHWSKIIAEKET
jgi:hypothetical protein